MISPSITVALEVNGRTREVSAMADTPLLLVLRNDLALNGPKYGCGLGECGACTVIIDGVAARSCVFPLAGAAGREIVTLEGLGTRQAPHPVQQAFIDAGAVQCGYCIPGMVLAGEALLAENLNPSRKDIRTAISGNLCRCTGYQQIVDAIQITANSRRGARNG